jgi:uncharacterized membrane protein
MAKQRWINVALVLSLSVNLLIAGAFLGKWLKRDADHRGPLGWATKTLDPTTRERLRPIMQENRAATRELRRRIRIASDEVRNHIRAESFDEVALAQSLAQLRDISTDYQLLVHRVALEALRELSPEEREHMGALLLRSPGARAGLNDMPHRRLQGRPGGLPPEPHP